MALSSRVYWGKRPLDLTLGAGFVLVTAPVMLGCALAVWWLDGRPVLFAQERVGRWGRPFRIFKFRTMRPAAGPAVTTSGDPRITPLGRRLRRLKLDELPQLWNVLAGAMSLVGPRPEVPYYVATAPHAFRRIEDLRPGVTDWASVALRDEEELLRQHAEVPGFYEQVLLPRKLALARLYRRHASPGLDLRILAATACLATGATAASRSILGPKLLRRARRGLTIERNVSDVN